MERVVGRGLPDQTTEPLDPNYAECAPAPRPWFREPVEVDLDRQSLVLNLSHVLPGTARCVRRTTHNRLEDGPVRVPIWDSTFIPLPGTALFATVAVTTTIAVHLLLAAAACTASASYRRPCDARQSALRSH